MCQAVNYYLASLASHSCTFVRTAAFAACELKYVFILTSLSNKKNTLQ